VKKYIPLAIAFLAGVALAGRVKGLPVLNKIPSI
jgi:hypothetical protein